MAIDKLIVHANCSDEEMKKYKEKLLNKAKELGMTIIIKDEKAR